MYEHWPQPKDKEPVPIHICPGCSSCLVQLVSFQASDDNHWELELRCPDCDLKGVGIFDQESAVAFEAEFVGAYDVVRDQADALARVILSQQVDAIDLEVSNFGKALEDGFILPEDF